VRLCVRVSVSERESVREGGLVKGREKERAHARACKRERERVRVREREHLPTSDEKGAPHSRSALYSREI